MTYNVGLEDVGVIEGEGSDLMGGMRSGHGGSVARINRLDDEAAQLRSVLKQIEEDTGGF